MTVMHTTENCAWMHSHAHHPPSAPRTASPFGSLHSPPFSSPHCPLHTHAHTQTWQQQSNRRRRRRRPRRRRRAPHGAAEALPRVRRTALAGGWGGGVWKGSEEDAAVRKGHAEGAKCIAVWYGYRSVSEQCGKRRLSRLVFTILDTMRDDAARGTGPYASALTDAGQPHTRARAHTHTQYSARKNDAKVLI